MTDQIKPTDLSQFIRLDGCQRYLHFQLHPETKNALHARYGTRPVMLPQLLQDEGERFEQAVLERLKEHEQRERGYQVISFAKDDGVTATLAALEQAARTPTILDQPWLEGQLGRWKVAGRADLIEVVRDKHGRLHALIADVKSSREERLEHRVQVAVYALLLQQLCTQAGLPLTRMLGAVVHQDNADDFRSLEDEHWQFQLGPYLDLVHTLTEGDGAALNLANTQPLDALPFVLNARCDGCAHCTVCLPHAAERADLALVPTISRAARSALAAHDIHDLVSLAALKVLNDGHRLEPSPDHRDRLAMLARDPLLAAQIDPLIARARSVLGRMDHAVKAPRFLADDTLAVLPDPQANPHLAQVFLDLQIDAVRNRVYLAAALIRTTRGEQIVVDTCDAPPDEAGEAALLVRWATDVEAAVRRLSTTDAPPLHVLVYDRRAQQVALEGCARHEDRHDRLAALVAWLQDQPQIKRATCARLREVVGKQHNLQLTCDSLYAVADRVWADNKPFRWPTHLQRLFRRGVFDQTNRFARDGATLRAAEPGEASVSLESSSRFSSQIPGEYAYAAWRNDPRQPTLRDLLELAEQRVHALAHLLAASNRYARGLDVPVLPLAQLRTAATPRDLPSTLRTFLELEHVAALSDLLTHLRLPVERRLLTGRTALLEAIAVEPDGKHARFRFTTLPGGGAVPPRFKVGDWVTLNEFDDQAKPWDLIKGRLAIIADMTDETVELELMALGKGGTFTFFHDSKLHVQLRCRYTLDDMADDLVAERVVKALDHLGTNVLACWLEAEPRSHGDMETGARGEGEQAPRRYSGNREQEKRASLHISFHPVHLVNPVEKAAQEVLACMPHPPTAKQRQVIADGSDEWLRLVQGPPGTGKSRTLGLAVVTRLVAAAQANKPLRVAVTAKTHSAVQVALDSIANAWQAYAANGTASKHLAELPIIKLGGEPMAPRAAGIEWRNPGKGKKGEWRALLDASCVLGGTPGGLDKLLGEVQKDTRWEGRFDLLLIDEASQMSMPEGLLAASALHGAGQMIVVGDHRQMPPIITHGWADVQGSLERWQPQRSLFAWLLDELKERDQLNLCVALDQSFRLHRDQASFLQDAIYQQDDIKFHSTRTALLPAHTFADPLIDAALRSDVPIAVIEHSERASQQSNGFEADLVVDLVQACVRDLGVNAHDGIGVVVPHRAQKAALRDRLPALARDDSIDTVERFQGGERDVIIVACTASEPEYILMEAEFLMDPQRLNVALSRARKKLIVLAASSVFGALPFDLQLFERAALWKRLRAHVAPHPLWHGERGGYQVQVLGPPVRTEK